MYKSSTTQINGGLVADIQLADNRTNLSLNNERAKFDAEVQMRTLRKQNQPDVEKYETQYKKDMQGLSIDRRSMETSMLAYTERMREITLQRSSPALQPLMVKPHDGRRWASLSILSNRNNNKDLTKMGHVVSFPERSMSADETQTSLMTPERDSLPERPFSDTHNRVFHFMDDHQHRLSQEGQFNDRIRARVHQRREMGFNTLRKNMDKFAELKTHYELHEDAYMPPPDDHKNVSIEIFPFPAIEIQAVPAVLHRNPKAEKQKKRKKKKVPTATLR